MTDKVTFHKSQVNFIRFIVLPLYKELQEFNQISLRIKYVTKDEKEKSNVFINQTDEKSINEQKDVSYKSENSVDINTQKLIMKKTKKMQNFLETLNLNMTTHENIVNENSK